MKIKDLINELSKLNPNSTVLFSNTLESHRSLSGCSHIATHQITEMDKDDLEEQLEDSDTHEEVKEEILKGVSDEGVVVFCVNGEETFCE